MKPSKIGPLLLGELRRLGLSTRLRSGMAPELWPRVVGPEIAAQTEAGPVRDRLLIVRTPNPVLAHQLRLMQREIMQRYRKILGGPVLRGVHVQIGQIATSGSTEERASQPAPISLPPEKEERLSGLAREIPDAVLSAAFLRLARKCAARQSARGTGSLQDFLALATGDTWPTAREMQAALDGLDPGLRDEAKNRAEEILRRKILARVANRKKDGYVPLDMRGDIRRLAMIKGGIPSHLNRDELARLLGPGLEEIMLEE